MAEKALPSPEVLRQLLRYEPETGKLFWRERGPEWFSRCTDKRGHEWAMRKWNGHYSGVEALRASKGNGYSYGTLLGRNVLSHRVAWAIHHGRWPSMFIDHKNGIRNDNRLENLREVDLETNTRNRKAASVNDWPGVGFYNQKWVARIRRGPKSIHLGTFSTQSEAVAARKEAEDNLWGAHVRT
jgi:hypothetical protein